MAPTIVLKDGKPFLVTGSPGGSRIITTVLQVIVNVIDRGMTLPHAVAAPRIHHQWLPDEVRAERGIAAETLAALAARGHTIAASALFDIGELDPGDARGPRRRRRHAHARGAGRGALKPLRTARDS